MKDVQEFLQYLFAIHVSHQTELYNYIVHLDGMQSHSQEHFCSILSTDTRIRVDSVMHPRSSSRGHNASASVTVTVTCSCEVARKIDCLVTLTLRACWK